MTTQTLQAPFTLYGIKNCDTVRKARKFLDAHAINFIFHDYRSDGLTQAMLTEFEQKLGYQALLNTRGTTWRQLPEETRNGVIDAQSAIAVMLAHPAMIKRPLLVAENNSMIIGFNEAQWLSFIQENV